jgi:hypothetical protein
MKFVKIHVKLSSQKINLFGQDLTKIEPLEVEKGWLHKITQQKIFSQFTNCGGIILEDWYGFHHNPTKTG